MTEQTYCDRLVQDTPFLMGHGRLSEQQVDRIILQLNRYYPQILSNKDAEKFRNPKASLRVRLCDLLGHLQRSGERDCREFYRALYIHAQPLHSRLPSRLAPRPVAFLACLGLAAGLALLVYCCPPGGCCLARPKHRVPWPPCASVSSPAQWESGRTHLAGHGKKRECGAPVLKPTTPRGRGMTAPDGRQGAAGLCPLWGLEQGTHLWPLHASALTNGREARGPAWQLPSLFCHSGPVAPVHGEPALGRPAWQGHPVSLGSGAW
uniref:Caspase recruitment domain-containing protein 19 n=1 Tax=Ailuropoda melanoleuca TaxID=9646 RepID=A0A7N5JIN6_AILME